LRTDPLRRRLDWTPLKNISPVLKEAVIQAEDKRFYEHGGVDYRSIGAALIQRLTSEGLRGASTSPCSWLPSWTGTSSKKTERRIHLAEGETGPEWPGRLKRVGSKAEIFEAYT